MSQEGPVWTLTKKPAHPAPTLLTSSTAVGQGYAMATRVLDTLAFAKKLKAAGFTDVQAETLAHAQAELIDERLATKADLERLELHLTIRMGGMLALAVAFLAALKLFG